MPIEGYGHRFTAHGAEEMICWTCGYVIWPSKTTADAERAIKQISGQIMRCGGAWQVFKREPIERESNDHEGR